MKKMLDALPPTLRVVTNFGLVDICPLRSGKHNAAAYLAREHFGIPLANCASMGDDDNDIALVRTDGMDILPHPMYPIWAGLVADVSQSPHPGMSNMSISCLVFFCSRIAPKRS